MIYIIMAVFAALILVFDQVTKYLTVTNIRPYSTEAFIEKLCAGYQLDPQIYDELPGKVQVIPKTFSLTHIHNDGGAWGMFDGAIWLFVVIFVIFAAFIIWEFSKKRMPFTTFERFCIVAVFAGGLGNIIDRLRFGFVIDMITTEFINFPIFNVADIFITCGCILLILHLIFFNKAFWKDDKKK